MLIITLDHGWTRRHGLFLLMGGFVLCNKDGKPIKTLSLGHFRRLLNEGVIDFPHLTSFEIQERSNLHPTFALIALLQSVWFIMHCLSRFVNPRPGWTVGPVITQLEATSAAIALVLWCIFIFAWKKPLDARSTLVKPTFNSSTLHNCDGLRDRVIVTVKDAFEAEHNLSGSQITERRIQLECPQQSQSTFAKLITTFRPTSLISILLWPLGSIFNDICRLVPPGNYGQPDFPNETLKIPLFYVQKTMFQHILLLPVAVVSFGNSIVSFLFVIHSNSAMHFSSAGALLTWRIASIVSISFSASILGLAFLSNFFYFLSRLLGGGVNQGCIDVLVSLSDICLAFVFSTTFVGLVPFLLARVVLLVASVVYLGFGSASGEAFMGRSWADYIPHVSY